VEVIAMRRLGVIVALGALLAMFGGALTTSPAVAGRGPKWQFQPAAPFTLPTDFCGFKVRVTFPVNKEYGKVLKSSDGSVTTLVTGSLTASIKNLQTGKAITENISGPGKLIAHPDGSFTLVAKGHEGPILAPADAQRFGLPTVSVTAGALTVSFAARGGITSLSLKGHVLVDICAALS
jgi:hypothetical protein